MVSFTGTGASENSYLNARSVIAAFMANIASVRVPDNSVFPLVSTATVQPGYHRKCIMTEGSSF